jgi:hypothetical protein
MKLGCVSLSSWKVLGEAVAAHSQCLKITQHIRIGMLHWAGTLCGLRVPSGHVPQCPSTSTSNVPSSLHCAAGLASLDILFGPALTLVGLCHLTRLTALTQLCAEKCSIATSEAEGRSAGTSGLFMTSQVCLLQLP